MEQNATRDLELSSVTDLKVEQVPFDAPWAWLAAGWRDLWSAPGISLSYGAAAAGLSAVLVFALLAGGLESLTLALAGGFLLVGPAAAVGMAEMVETSERQVTPVLRQFLLRSVAL